LCGKSTALHAWKQAGAFALSCDEIVREISDRPVVQKKICAALGTCEPTCLARKVFASCAARKKLEAILHPLVYKEIATRLKKSTAVIRVIEVPLLFETRWEKFFDVTITLVTPEKLLRARAKQRGISRADLTARRRAQLPQVQKAARADICILNDTTKNDLTEKIKNLYRAFSRIY
jgi:dephospho-CoA kinase